MNEIPHVMAATGSELRQERKAIGTDMEEDKKYYQIGSLEKGVKILEAIIENGELTVSGTAALMGMNRASAHRFINTLKDLGYVRKNQHNKYEATFKMLEYGMKQADNFEIRRLAKPYLRKISSTFEETVNLGILDRDKIVYLDKVESLELLRMDTGVGTSCQAYVSALGKAILAFLPDEELKTYLDGLVMAEALTPNTITTIEKLEKNLAKVRRLGYAVDNEELSTGLFCVGVPVFDFNGYPTYAISVSGLVARVKKLKKQNQLSEKLIECAAKLSRQLGHRKVQPGLK